MTDTKQAAGSQESTVQKIIDGAKEVFDVIGTVSPAIPLYGPLIGTIAKMGAAVIAMEPSAVATFEQIKTTIQGGTPPTQAQLDEWAAASDTANANLEAHIQEQLKAGGA